MVNETHKKKMEEAVYMDEKQTAIRHTTIEIEDFLKTMSDYIEHATYYFLIHGSVTLISAHAPFLKQFITLL